MEFTNEWTLDNALHILQHPTVDAQLWAEAVEWLLIHGPLEIREALQQAAGHATCACFPELKAKGFTPGGEPCYQVADLARALGIPEEEAAAMLKAKEEKHGRPHLFGMEDTHKIQ